MNILCQRGVSMHGCSEEFQAIKLHIHSTMRANGKADSCYKLCAPLSQVDINNSNNILNVIHIFYHALHSKSHNLSSFVIQI